MTHRCAATMAAFHRTSEEIRREASACLAAFDQDPRRNLAHLIRAADLHDQEVAEEWERSLTLTSAARAA